MTGAMFGELLMVAPNYSERDPAPVNRHDGPPSSIVKLSNVNRG